ncbi:MAG: hypothetical protein WCT04_24050 [Planctomycetota bacterium]
MKPAYAIILIIASAQTLAFSAGYQYDIIAQSGQNDQSATPLGTILDGVSINDGGTVAFAAQIGVGQSLFIGDGVAAPKNITSGFIASNRTFSANVQINNGGIVAGRDQVSGAPAQNLIRLWDSGTGAFTTIARGPQNFDAVAGVVSVNNSNIPVFLAISGANTLVATPSGGAFNSRSYSGAAAIRPMIADSGLIVLRDGNTSTSPIVLCDSTFTTATPIASASDYGTMGRSPGISDDGQTVVFYGDIGATAATQNSTTPGPGIFASVLTKSGRRLVRIADASHFFSGLDADTRVGISSIKTGGSSITVVFGATVGGTIHGIYSCALNFLPPTNGTLDTADPAGFSVDAPLPVVTAGQTVGSFGPITSFDMYDPINVNGVIAFWATTGSGSAVIRATPTGEGMLNVSPNVTKTVAPSVFHRQYLDDLGKTHNYTLSVVFKPITFTVKGKPALEPGTKVYIICESIDDGADHETTPSVRPHGWLYANAKAANPNAKTVLGAGVVVGGDVTTQGIDVTADSKGNVTFVYVAPEISGTETITLTSTSYADAKQIFRVGIDGLEALPAAADGSYDATYGSKPPHLQNHYGTPSTITAIQTLALKYQALQNDPKTMLSTDKKTSLQAFIAATNAKIAALNPPQSYRLANDILLVNDISIPRGGLFDVNGDFSAPHGGHRYGTNCDLGTNQIVSSPINASKVSATITTAIGAPAGAPKEIDDAFRAVHLTQFNLLLGAIKAAHAGPLVESNHLHLTFK